MAQYAGKRIGRLDGEDKSTGKAKYAGDYFMDGMLELALVRSEKAHARLVKVEVPPLPEGLFVFTAKDYKENIVEDLIEDQPILAYDKVRFLGEPVAIVAAPTRLQAQACAKRIKVVYEELPVLADARQAMAPGAEKIHANGNLLSEFHYEKGDVAHGLESCALRLEDAFHLPAQDHACMEPEACFSYMEDGALQVIAATQNVFHDKRMILRALGLKEEQAHVRAATVGGGFGGKDGNTAQLFTALATQKTGRPAKLVLERQESLLATYKRHGADIHVKMGFASDGTIVAFDGCAYLDTGAYAGLGPAVMGLFSEHFAGPYEIENVRMDVFLVYTNKAVAHAMRGFGAPQGAFATETLISRAAHALNLDPIAIRKTNALRPGGIGALGQPMEHCVGMVEALELVEHSALWKERERNADPFIGYGVAAGHLSCGLGKNVPDTAKVEIETRGDGIAVKIGLVDIGQGSMTALAAMAADALDIPLNQVHMVMADTRCTYDCGSTAGSRSTFIAGNALIEAAGAYKARRAHTDGPVTVSAAAAFPESSKSFHTPGFPHAMYTFIAQAVKLRMDPRTGKTELLDIYSATEAGRIINPLSLDGQMQGGIAMSIGYALMEDCRYQSGMALHRDFHTYLLPTAMDVPQITNVSVDMYEQSGPMGVKGAAEVATVAIAPAIGAAIHEVTGVWQTSLPFTASLDHIDRSKYLHHFEGGPQ